MESTPVDSTVLTLRRTITLLVSILVALCCGTNYVYSAYGPQLGRRLLLTHAEQNLVGLSGNFGMYASAPFLGKLADSRGPRLSLALASVLLLVGYLGTKAVYDASDNNTEPAGPGTLSALILFRLLSGIGTDAAYCAALNAVVRSFPDKIRTIVLGLVISDFGLSAFLSFPQSRAPSSLETLQGSCSHQQLGQPPPWCSSGNREEPHDTASTPIETSRLIGEGDPVRSPNVTSLAMIRTVDFWILFSMMPLLTGSGIIWINNVGLMARALAHKSDTIPDERERELAGTSSLDAERCKFRWSHLNCVTADLAKHRGMRLVQSIPTVAAPFLISQLIGLYVQHIEQLQYAVALVGMLYGASFALLPIILIEWFGMVHVSENAGFLGLSPLAMANIFSIIFGRVFNSHSSLGGHGMRSLEGARCYSASLYVTAFACFCALILAFVGVERDRKYR